MAIYNRWGSELRIIQKCGEHQPPGFTCPAMLVKCKFADDGEERYHFAAFLKADGGWQDIQSAIDMAPWNVVSGTALIAAIEEAL